MKKPYYTVVVAEVVNPRLPIDKSVTGWSSPKITLHFANSSSCICAASVNFPCWLYVKARLCILVNVSGWSCPKVSFLFANTSSCICAASVDFPCQLYVTARSFMLIRVGWMTTSHNSCILSLYFPSFHRNFPSHSMMSAAFLACPYLILSNGVKTWLK